MGFSAHRRHFSAGMAMGPEFFCILPGAAHLLDIGSSCSVVHSALGGIRSALGGCSIDEPRPRDSFPVSLAMACATSVAGSFAMAGPGDGDSLILPLVPCPLDGPQLRRIRKPDSDQG